MEELRVLVKGSSADPYEITFIKDGSSLTALCTCPAGTYGNFCKHRIAVLDGDAGAVLEDDAKKVPLVVEWMAGTDVSTALGELREAEGSGDKDAVATAKRKLARAMNS